MQWWKWWHASWRTESRFFWKPIKWTILGILHHSGAHSCCCLFFFLMNLINSAVGLIFVKRQINTQQVGLASLYLFAWLILVFVKTPQTGLVWSLWDRTEIVRKVLSAAGEAGVLQPLSTAKNCSLAKNIRSEILGWLRLWRIGKPWIPALLT